MAAEDVVNRAFREFNRYTGDGKPGEPTGAPLPVGDPQSGVHHPKKVELRAMLIEVLVSMGASLEEATAQADRSEHEADRALEGADRAENYAAFAGTASGRLSFKTVAALLADTTMGYAGSDAAVIVGPGDVVEAWGNRYEVAASGASDHHLMTIGGVNLKVLQKGGMFYDSAFGVKGSGLDETAAFQKACSVSAAAGKTLVMTGLDIVASFITVTQKLRIVGSGSLTKLAGTSGVFITSSADLTISGNITIDPNAEGNPNSTPTGTSDTGITHTGARLILHGVAILGALSSCVRTTASQFVSIKGCEISGGWINVFINVPSSCRVFVQNNAVHSSHRDDCLQVLGGGDVLVDGNSCYNSGRSGIVISAAASSCRIVNNNCFGNKKEASTGQGGWGIVASVDCSHFIISNNNCANNETGGITADTYNVSNPSYTSAHHVIANNVVDGDGNLNPDGYCVTGISINGSRFASVTGNYVRRANQGILMSDPWGTTVSGNTIREIGEGATFFIQALRGKDVMIASNTFDGAGASANTAAVGIFTSDKISVVGNKIENVTGSRTLFRLTDAINFVVSNNDHHKIDAGSGFIFQITGTCSDGEIRGNSFICSAASYQYYINATGAIVTGTITHDNAIICPGIQTTPNRYILSAPAMKADNDNINGLKNYFSAAPTMFTPLTGAVAGISGALKMWNGSAWV